MTERIRKRIILRAYNRRSTQQKTFYDQFKEIVYVEKDNKEYIDYTDLRKYLDLKDFDLSELSQNKSNQKQRIGLNEFVYFLTYGIIRESNKQHTTDKSIENAIEQNNPIVSHEETAGDVMDKDSTPTNEVPESQEEDESLTVIIDQELGTNVEMYKSTSDNKVINNKNNLALIKFGSHENSQKERTKNVWRKSEVVKQERIVSYITVDAQGACQVSDEKNFNFPLSIYDNNDHYC